MIITNLYKKEKELLINSIINTIDKLKESEKIDSYKKILQTIKETEPVDYPNPRLIKSFSKMLGGGFIEVFRMDFRIYQYFSEDQMKEHKKEMIKIGFNSFDGEVTRDQKIIDRKLVVTYTKPEK